MSIKKGSRCSAINCNEYSFNNEYPFHKFPADHDQ